MGALRPEHSGHGHIFLQSHRKERERRPRDAGRCNGQSRSDSTSGHGDDPLEIATRKAGPSLKLELRWGLGGISAKEVMFFTQELSTLVNAGLPLDRSLTICKQLSGRPKVQAVVEDVLEGIKQGKDFCREPGGPS